MFISIISLLVFAMGDNSTDFKTVDTSGLKTVLAEDEREADQELTLKSQRGEKIKLSDLHGKVVFLNFWASWCAPCVTEMPGIDGLYQEFSDEEEVVFLMVTMDRSFRKARQFREKWGFHFDIYKIKGRIPYRFRVESIPTTFILDKSGRIVYSHAGAQRYYSKQFVQFLNYLSKQDYKQK